MSALNIANLSKRFGTLDVLKDINLNIQSGEFVVLVGPSGCGKSTLLSIIAGLEKASGGNIEIAGKLATDVWQRIATSPWCSNPMRSIRP
jgi:ABC-type sugar transport system ATPase subunit